MQFPFYCGVIFGGTLIRGDQSEEIEISPDQVWFGETEVFTRENCIPKYGSRGIEILAKVGEVVGNVEVAVHGGMEAVVQSIANHKLVWNSTETWTEPSEWLELRLFALSSKSSKSEKNL